MKRKDFLQKMRNRRRRDQLERRETGQRRAADWRTLRVDLPGAAEEAGEHELSVGSVALLPTGVRLRATESCWVRGYRMWTTEDGRARAEFQYRPVADPENPPPGAEALAPDDVWEPDA